MPAAGLYRHRPRRLPARRWAGQRVPSGDHRNRRADRQWRAGGVAGFLRSESSRICQRGEGCPDHPQLQAQSSGRSSCVPSSTSNRVLIVVCCDQAQRELPDTAARRWDELLWAGFLREGVDVQEDVGRVTGATTIQRMYRGRLGRSTERSRDAARGRYAAARQRGETLALALEREQLGWFSPVQMTRMQGRLDEQSRRLARHKRTIRLRNASSPASFTSCQI